ncbi:MAG: hypothetical protein EXS09_11740 [Gemmataceae bacterium]|nr:hypothetical protein [Gemmataceae bacterium]
MLRVGQLCLMLSALAISLLPADSSACPFCPSAGQTLLGESKQAHFIVFGTMTNAVRDKDDFGKGTTDFEIDVVVKDHEFLKGKKKIVLQRYIPPDPKNKTKHLVFFEIYKGEPDPYRGEAVAPDSKIAEYLKGAIAIKDKDVPTRLYYYLKNFDSADWAISADAFQEFSNADYKDVREATKKMDPDHLLKMLKDPNTSIARYGLIGMLLGHCGKAEVHGKALLEFVNDPKVKQATGLDGLLAGCIMLDLKKGMEFVTGLINDKNEDFLIRYASLRCMRFFFEYRDDVVKKTDIVNAMKPLLDQSDIVDLAVEDLRKWHQWDLAPKLIALFDKPAFDIPIVQRSIIKFALDAPATDKNAAAFLERMRSDQKQSDRVKDLEQLLELEKPRPPEPKNPAKDK